MPDDPRPICFMIMPYGVKPTQAAEGAGAPVTVDFDALWDRVLRPLIEEDLGYEAVRADQDVGALIIQEMIERLALSDVVLADVTAPNANVYYEVGVRHAAHQAGCVLIAASWARPLFDLAQVRGVRYPLPEGTVTEATAQAARAVLKGAVGKLTNGPSLVWTTLPGYPGPVDAARTSAFRKRVSEVSARLATITSARRVAPAERKARALEVRDELATAARNVPGIAVELMYLLRDVEAWGELIAFVDALPDGTRAMPVVQEQYHLARSKSGDHHAAIEGIEALIATSGDSSERRGLLGGRYKKLKAAASGDTRAHYLDRAIEEYDRGMRLDLNDYYPASNLPRLLRERGAAGDEARARAAATVTVLACERAVERSPGDGWVRPTMLGAAFDTGDVATAARLVDELRRVGVVAFNLGATLPDLELAISLQPEATTRAALTTVLDDARRLLPKDSPPGG